MELKLQKRLASQLLKCSPKRIHFDAERLEDIKEAILFLLNILNMEREGRAVLHLKP